MLIQITNLTGSNISIESLNLLVPRFGIKSISIDIVTNEDNTEADILSELNSLSSAGHISFTTSEDPDVADEAESPSLIDMVGVYKIDMDDAADVTGGGTIQTVGFQVRDIAGRPITSAVLIGFAAFDDADMATSAANATLDTAAEGTIVGGAASAVLKIRTTITGRFSCVLTDATDEIVYLSCAHVFGGPTLIALEVDSVEFSA